MRKLRVTIFTVMAVAAAVGCGSDDGGTETQALSKAAFIKQADAICEEADRKQEANFLESVGSLKKAGNLTTAEQNELFVSAGLPPLEAELEELAELGVPSGDEAEIEAMLDGIEEAIEVTAADPQRGNPGPSNPFNKVNKLAREYGFKACSETL